MPSAQETFLGKGQRLAELALLDTDAGQMQVGRAGCLGTPGGLEERVIGLGQLFQHLQRKSQIEVGFTGVGIGIAPGLLADRGAEIRHALFDLRMAQEIETAGIVEAKIGGIPPQAFQVVIHGQEGGVAVLFEMLTGQVELLE